MTTTISTLYPDRLAELLTPVLLQDGDVAQADRTIERDQELFARCVWASLIEPGDRIAGIFVTVLGARRALETVIRERGDAPSLLRSLPGETRSILEQQMSLSELHSGLHRWLPRLSKTRSEEMLKQTALIGAKILFPTDTDWPPGLDDLDAHRPMVLWMRGQPENIHRSHHSIALVGARAASAYGEHVVSELATGLDQHGYEVLSGGAYGIDGMAHRAALANHSSTTVVLAGGIDRLYPSGHEALFQRVLAQGVIYSEVSPGTAPSRWRFLQRNRLIAAISQATIVVEAGFRSGSINTAGHALQLGRALGAVPGPVTSPVSAGCHRLIREYQAELITGTPDALSLLGAPAEAEQNPGELLTAGELRALDALTLSRGKTSLSLAQETGMSLSEVEGHLGTLELKNLAQRDLDQWLKLSSAD